MLTHSFSYSGEKTTGTGLENNSAPVNLPISIPGTIGGLI